MSTTFERALSEQLAPRIVGEMRLRYDSPVLIAEAARRRRGVAALTPLAVACALACALALLLLSDRSGALSVALGIGAVVFSAAAAMTDRWSRLRRRFVVDFDAHTLRLDFTSRWTGRPRTHVLPFSAIASVDLVEHEGGSLGMTVDFLDSDGERWRDVLIAHALPKEAEALEGLHRTLTAAFDR